MIRITTFPFSDVMLLVALTRVATIDIIPSGSNLGEVY